MKYNISIQADLQKDKKIIKIKEANCHERIFEIPKSLLYSLPDGYHLLGAFERYLTEEVDICTD